MYQQLQNICRTFFGELWAKYPSRPQEIVYPTPMMDQCRINNSSKCSNCFWGTRGPWV